MEKKAYEILGNIKQHIVDGELGTAIRETENVLLSGLLKGNTEQFESIKNEYELLYEYWRKGYSDPRREELYQRMLQRLFVLVANMEQRARLVSNPYLTALYQEPRQASRNWSMLQIRRQLEDFVSNAALLDLEPEHVREGKEQQLFTDHYRWLNDLFNYIVSSMQWSEPIGDAFIEVLNAPTVDVSDQQLIVSAITLSCMNNFDMEKLRVLVRTYQQATDEELRQRALVGWVVCLNEYYLPLFPEQAELVKELCDDSRCRDELTELQMQLFYSHMADSDSKTIEKDIMPDLIKGNSLKLTRSGLEELEVDQLEEILNPEKTEQNMERMEQRINQMADMQRQGSDVYFSGFKQMKRFPFFQKISSWFLPFNPKHPAVNSIWQQSKYSQFLKTIMKASAFCNSDKYSFTLAFNDVVKALPASMLDMIEKGEASPIPVGGMVSEEVQQSAAYLRRSYLQDIYRFTRLCPVKSLFRNIFESSESITFFPHAVFQDTALRERFNEVAAFLLKRGFNNEALFVLTDTGHQYRDYQFYMLYARAAKLSQYDAEMEPEECYQEALKLRPDDTKALRGYARECFAKKRYADADKAYDKLLKSDADNATLLLSKAACLANLGQYEEALKMLYWLNYEQPDNSSVSRVLAWTLTENHQFEAAVKIYERLLKEEEPIAEDYFNAAYCQWLAGRVSDAINALRHYREVFDIDSKGILKELNSERHRLSKHGLTDIDFKLMRDAVCA